MQKLPTILEKIIVEKHKEISRCKAEVALETLRSQAETMPPCRDFFLALKRSPTEPIRLIAEYKRASPSKGEIRADLTPTDVARAYEKGGASAMSVLTDGPFFRGSLDDLREVRKVVGLPILRKDFILGPYQLVEARAVGADAVLLIVAALSDESLAGLQKSAADLGLSVLVEVHNEEELGRALASGAAIVGINNRDLHTFKVDLETTLRLRPLIPEGIVVVGESGIHSRDDGVRLEKAGVDAMLVGEHLMVQPDSEVAVATLLGRGQSN